MLKESHVAVLFVPGVVLLVSPLLPPAYGFVPETLCLAGLFVLVLREGRKGGSVLLPPGAFPLFFLFVLGVLQLIPLPPFLLEVLAPLTAEWYGHSVWLIDPESAMPLSIRPKSTLIQTFHLFAGGALFVVTAAVAGDRERLRKTVYLFCAFGGLFALLHLLAMMGVVNLTEYVRISIPFLAPLLPLCIGLYIADRPEASFGTRMERALDFCRRPSAYPHRLAAVSALLCGMVLLSASGRASFSAGIGILFYAFILFSRSARRKAAVALFFLAFFFILAAIPRRDFPVGRFFEEIQAFPTLFGSGFGTRDLVPRGGAGEWNFLTGVIEFGGIGFFLGAVFLVTFLAKNLSAWRQRRRRFPVFLGAATLGAAAVPAILFLGWPLPTNESQFYLFMALAGLASGACASSVGKRALPLSRPLRYGSATAIALVFFLHLLFHGGILSAARFDGANPEMRLIKAIGLDPLEDGYRFALGQHALAAGEGERGSQYFGEAVRWCPLTGESLQGLALAKQKIGRTEESGRLLEASLTLGSGVREGYRKYVQFLLETRRVPEGRAFLRRALEREPEDTAYYLTLVEEKGWSPQEIKEVLPSRFTAWAAYGDYLTRRGSVEAGAESYRAALAYLEADSVRPEAVAHVTQCLARQGDIHDALTAVEGGLRAFPGDAVLRRLAADLYERAGLTVRAREERTAMQLLQGGSAARAQ